MDANATARTAATTRGPTEGTNETSPSYRAVAPPSHAPSGAARRVAPRLAGAHRLPRAGVPANLGAARRPSRLRGPRRRSFVRATTARPVTLVVPLAGAHAVLRAYGQSQRPMTTRKAAKVPLAFLALEKAVGPAHLPPPRVPVTPAPAGRRAPAADAVEAELWRQKTGPLTRKARKGVRPPLAKLEGRETRAGGAGASLRSRQSTGAEPVRGGRQTADPTAP